MRSKRSRMAFFCVLILCLSVFATTAFAVNGYYASDERGNNTPPDAIDNITVNTEGVTLPPKQDSKPLTPDGNMNLIDDILQNDHFTSVEEGATVDNKQFITIETKNGNVFYLVIDRSGSTENVYFLNLVDESDLLALLEDTDEPVPVCTCTDKCMVGAIKADCEICRTNMKTCIGKETVTDPTPAPDTVPNEKDPGNPSILLLIVLLLVGAGGALYWFKYRTKSDVKSTSDLDQYDYNDDENEYEAEEDL